MTQPPSSPYGPPDEPQQYPGSPPVPPGPAYGQPGGQYPPPQQAWQQDQDDPRAASSAPQPSFAGPPDAPHSARQSLAALRDPSFFPTLFSLDFNHFITGRVLGVVYGLIMVLLGIGYLVAVVTAFNNSAGAGILTVVVGALAFVVYLIFARITLEFYAAMIKTAENTGRLLEREQGRG